VSVLVLHRGPLEGSPYDEWLADYDGDVLLLASREQLELSGEELPRETHYRHVEAVSGYDVSGRVELRALELARADRVRHIIACQERDLERAAQLREILGLPGQRPPSATAFRDKVAMKELVRAAMVSVGSYAEVECATDLIAFARAHGFPLVLKPRDGSGSVGLRILHSAAELDALLADESLLAGGLQPNLIVEAFVSGSLCHVDGLVVDGRVVFAWPSQHLSVLGSFEDDPNGRLDVTLDGDDPLGRRLLALTDHVLDALPGPAHFAFHAEVFHTPEDRLVLCEIACRTGGGSIRDITRTLFGADPTEWWVRAQVGLPLGEVEDARRLQPARMAGQLVLMKRPGRVAGVPGRPPFAWVQRSRVFVQPGEVMDAAAPSGDVMAAFVVSAPTRDVTVARLRELEAWFAANIAIAEPCPAATSPTRSARASIPARVPAPGPGQRDVALCRPG
jgi:hypothetical protein